MQLKWKVCGMKFSGNIEQVALLQPDFMGFIFYPKSPRYVGDLDPSSLQAFGHQIKKVGVFVNESAENMLKISKQFFLDYLQLHGNESLETCAKLQNEGGKVIKAFSVGNNFDFQVLNGYKPHVDAFLFDTKGEHYGGNGTAFDWSILNKYDNEKPFFLSGGIGLENIANLQNMTELNIIAIDVNSRFELEPGLKDVEKLKDLKEKIAEIKFKYQKANIKELDTND